MAISIQKEDAKAERLRNLEIANAEAVIKSYMEQTGLAPEYTLLDNKVYFKFTYDDGRIQAFSCRYENFWKSCENIFRLAAALKLS